MPYITAEVRNRFDADKTPEPQTPGELNYLFTKLIRSYLGEFPTYRDFNDVVGALECAKMELYRRVVSKYEDVKIKENGDVY